MRHNLVALFLLLCSVHGFGQPAGHQEESLLDPIRPAAFMPEVFNRFGYVHGRLVFAPGGEEAFWVISTVDQGRSIDHRLILKRHPDGTWLEPQSSFLSVDRKENSPSYSVDGQRVFYQSRAPLAGNGACKDLDIWYRDRNGEGWGIPVNLGMPVNSGDDESQPWVTPDGSLFFCRQHPDTEHEGRGGSDIWFSQCINGTYSPPVCLGPEINSSFQETEPVMAPDGSYLLFLSNRPGGYSRMMNLYVSYRTPEGGWTKAISLSHRLKIDNIWFPTITAYGEYLFFCGGYPSAHGYNKSQYYRVSTSLIDALNPHRIQPCPAER